MREIGTSQDLLNFGEVVRISKTTNPKNGKLVNRKMPMYNLTRDGFSLLAMGFTGKKALQFKIAFINAFNEIKLKGGLNKARNLALFLGGWGLKG